MGKYICLTKVQVSFPLCIFKRPFFSTNSKDINSLSGVLPTQYFKYIFLSLLITFDIKTNFKLQIQFRSYGNLKWEVRKGVIFAKSRYIIRWRRGSNSISEKKKVGTRSLSREDQKQRVNRTKKRRSKKRINMLRGKLKEEHTS